jgi:predicted transcriptional regulator
MTEKAKKLMESAREALGAIGQNTNPSIQKFVEDEKLGEQADSLFIQLGKAYSPDPIGLAHIVKISPYANPEAFKVAFKGAVERGWMEAGENGSYTVTEKGKKAYEKLLALLNETLSSLEDKTSADLKKLISLLEKTTTAVRKTDAIKEKPAVELGKRFEPKGKASDIAWVRRHLASIFNYRDDVHVAAWAQHKVEGYVWEAFSFAWEGEAHTPAELVEKVGAFRNYDEEAYAGAYKSLVKKGWVKEVDGKFEVTEKGKALRQETEDQTDEYFGAAFTSISDEDFKELFGLLAQLAEDLKPEKEEEEAS